MGMGIWTMTMVKHYSQVVHIMMEIMVDNGET